MKKMTQRKSWIALLALLFLFAACKGDSPTAPPSGGGGTPGGGTPPPTGATLVLTASNADPLVDSTVVFTATVTQDGKPVPNGTAVEFSSNGGGLDGTSATSILKTTTNGVATVTLTSSIAKTIRVRAAINNVAQTVDVTFHDRPVVDPGGEAPVINSVSPATGRPSGGQSIRINGANFDTPVRVLFDTGSGTPVEAFVVAVTDTTIDVLTPGVNLGAGQQLAADVIVITKAGSTSEQRVESAGAFTFRNELLTPLISTATPNSGPITGGTRVSIFGEGFQAPVQVLFGTAEARVITVQYSEIIVETPSGRDTSPTGGETVVGPVDITVRNINSATSATMTSGFHYKNAMQITAAGPTEGPASGGTRVTIEGTGFVAPVAVTIGGIAAQPISVSGTKIIAITGAPELGGCADVSGAITVTNIANGDTAEGPSFTYDVPQPSIVNVSPTTITFGTDSSFNVTVANALPGLVRFQLGDKTVFPSSVSYDPATFVAVYTIPVPTNFEFDTTTCGTDGERFVALVLDVVYTNTTTGCTDTATNALTVNPADASCREPAPAILAINPVSPTCASAGNVASAGATTGTATITLSNTAAAGAQDLEVTAATIGTQTNGAFTIDRTTATIAPGASQDFIVTVDPTAVGAFGTTVSFSTSAGPGSACVSGNGT